MNVKISIFITSIFFASAALASQEKSSAEINYRQAQDKDVTGIVTLINEKASADNDKIVVLPKKFREAAVIKAVSGGRIFIAEYCDKSQKAPSIIGFKKLFCLTDEKELQETLQNELRCIGQKPFQAGSTTINQHCLDTFKSNAQEIDEVLKGKTTYVYDGADYTDPQFRQKGINSKLTQVALDHVKSTIVKHITQQKSNYLAIAYGLAQSNAGSSILEGRTSGIAKVFIPFACEIAQITKHAAPLQVICSRHEAFMPTFDPEDSECKPLPDKQAIPGFGCLLACALKPAENKDSDSKQDSKTNK